MSVIACSYISQKHIKNLCKKVSVWLHGQCEFVKPYIYGWESTLTQDETPERVYYYGKCMNPGKKPKWHSGHHVEPYVNDNSIIAVRTHCGNQIFLDEAGEGQRPPALNEELDEDLCKVCHRSYAWGVMKNDLAQRRQVENDLAREIDALVVEAETSDMGVFALTSKLRDMAEELRRKVQPVPIKGNAVQSQLRLVGNDS